MYFTTLFLLLAAFAFLVGALRGLRAAGALTARIDWLCFGLFFLVLARLFTGGVVLH